METALYLLPVTLGDTPVEKVLPSYNKEIISGIRHFIVEDIRSARRFLKKVDREIDIDALTFYPLNKHTSPEDISGYLKPLVGGASMGWPDSPWELFLKPVVRLLPIRGRMWLLSRSARS